MINPFKDINWKPDIAERKKFAKSFMIGFPIIAIIFLLLGWVKTGRPQTNINLALWIGCCGFAAGVIFYLIPQIASPFYVVWYFIASCIGFVVSNLIMALFYYLVLTPFGLIRRLFSKDSFPKTFDRNAKTYWKDAKQVDDPSQYYKQF